MIDQRSLPILYHSNTSVCAQKVRLVLAELDMMYDSRLLDLKAGDQFASDYLSINPNGSVPTLIMSGKTYIDSNDILLALAGRSNGAWLWPEEERQRSECALWLERSRSIHVAVHIVTTLAINYEKLKRLSRDALEKKVAHMPNQSKAMRLKDVALNGAKARSVKDAAMSLQMFFQALKTALENESYLCGENVSLADFAILPFVQRLKFLGVGPEYWLSPHATTLQFWLERMSDRKSYEIAVSDFHSKAALGKFQMGGQKLSALGCFVPHEAN